MRIRFGAHTLAPFSWITLVPAVFSVLTGCSASASDGVDGVVAEKVGVTTSAIYGGVLDDDAQAHDAVVALRVGDGSPFELCTGTLIAPNVVMTARHCISKTITDDIGCDEKGNSLNGDQVGDDVSPRTVHVLTGATPDFGAEPAASGKLIFRPVGKAICNTDIALVVLDRSITGIAPLGVRLTGGPKVGEDVTSVGFGQNDQGEHLGTRFRKAGVRVIESGSTAKDPTTGKPATGSSEFQVGKSICQGDSGGPAIDEATGEVVGVVSRGVDCNLDFGHLYTKTSLFMTLFQDAFAEAGQTPLLAELATSQLSQTLKNGTTSATAEDGTTATTTQAQSATSDGGCAVAAPGTRRTTGSSALLTAFAGLVVAARLRRRR